MNKIKNYTIGLSINNISGEFNPSEISFSLFDSIYSPFCRGSLQINDSEGLALEGRGFIPGSKICLTLGYNNIFCKSSFVVNSIEDTNSSLKSSQLNGVLNINLIHESFSSTKKLSKAYNQIPSQIVRNLFEYKFPSYEIEETRKSVSNILYRPYLTELNFINKILIPNSISSSEKISPYFFFIDIHGTLHYESFFRLMKKSSEASLFLGHKERFDNYFEKIFSFYPFTESLENVNNSVLFELSYIDIDSKNLVKEKIDIASLSFGEYPIFETEISSELKFDEFRNKSLIPRTRSHVFSNQKEALLPEKAIVILPLYTELTSGKIVDIEAKYHNGYSSYSYLGNYIIERSSHVWNGIENSGYTQLVISKPFLQFPPNSIIEEGIYSV